MTVAQVGTGLTYRPMNCIRFVSTVLSKVEDSEDAAQLTSDIDVPFGFICDRIVPRDRTMTVTRQLTRIHSAPR
jgi:hypothetical protein